MLSVFRVCRPPIDHSGNDVIDHPSYPGLQMPSLTFMYGKCQLCWAGSQLKLMSLPLLIQKPGLESEEK